MHIQFAYYLQVLCQALTPQSFRCGLDFSVRSFQLKILQYLPDVL